MKLIEPLFASRFAYPSIFPEPYSSTDCARACVNGVRCDFFKVRVKNGGWDRELPCFAFLSSDGTGFAIGTV